MKKNLSRYVALSMIWACLTGFAPSLVSAGESGPATVWKDFVITDFTAVHAPVHGDPNEHLIFGNIPILPPANNLSPDLAGCLGRWEGYDYSPPIKKDIKIVLVIQEITDQSGRAFVWQGTNLQYPLDVKEIQFRVIAGSAPTIEWEAQVQVGTRQITATVSLSYNQATKRLQGGLKLPGVQQLKGQIELEHSQSFYVYRDYEQYLASKRIYPKPFQQTDAQQYSPGYLVYLPEGYETNPGTTWPAIIFLCGSGDRGDNLFLLSKASPFMMIREKGPIPFIIVAPGLKLASYPSFPENYLDGVLAEILATYHVDQQRIYLTGLSMGGEATYRFALHRPEMFAAIAPLAATDPKYHSGMIQAGFTPLQLPLERMKTLPVWAIHGANDEVVPVATAEQTVSALQAAGGDIRLTILADHDHDVWSDAYTDSKFYEWFLQHTRP